MKEREFGYFDLQFIKATDPAFRNMCLDYLDLSRSQLRQDLFTLSQVGFERGGFFVELGVTDGVELSNSWLLENEFGWSGILAETARVWHGDLKNNRSCTIDTRCVWTTSGETLTFSEAAHGESSAIERDVAASGAQSGASYDVETVSLADLLEQHNAPDVIDYISIDAEGREFDILDAFDFDRWSFRVMTVEHNFGPQREDIHRLLSENGYIRVLDQVSRFDDWYVKND